MPHVQIGDLQVEVVRKNIQSLRLTVYAPDGRIRVAVPTRTPHEAVQEFVVARRAWIRKHQEKFQARVHPAALAFVSGETHYYQGKGCLLQVHETTGVPQVIYRESQVLDLFVREDSTPEQREKVLAAWYRKQLKAQLPAMVAKWQQVVGVQVNEWGVKQMKTRWGTCNIRAKRIWLNLELIKRPTTSLEYVVAHELVHLHERLHNARFWRLMDQFMPGWQMHREELKKAVTDSPIHSDAC
ncbi:M48 family metallopeptidase [Hymenobacter tibetensis]|uniref:M48 family metallopeptidase n=1 Tax=Hymenobacter tibetensis TaxID=497967 RepID=A0ABY4D181_9BACT|nr:SprT family zinc-dependent metalloprotease [Hymenobacter tibetensis]UOG76296.1 M48 family metallopeptidase [Hymenobacter tibetensis]